MEPAQWRELQTSLEEDDVRKRVWLSTWFVDALARRPDILEGLWGGSVECDAVGWRWCEYRVIDRANYPNDFLALYGNYFHVLPRAPVFVLRAQCRHCQESGFFVSIKTERSARELAGVPRGRCASCRRNSARASRRRSRERRMPPP